MFPQMPKIDTSKLDNESLNFAKQITKKNGDLYSSKPKNASGEAKYVWRLVMFYVSNKPQHHCMPVCADFDIEEKDYQKRLLITKELDNIVKKIVNSIPLEKQYGSMRWAKAMGAF